MGLFNFLRPKKTELEQELGEFIDHLHPGGTKEILFKANEVLKMSNGRLTVNEAAKIYGQAKVRYTVTATLFDGVQQRGATADDLVHATMKDSDGKLNSTEAARIVYYVVFDQVDHSLETILTLRKYLEGLFGTDRVGCDTDEIPTGIGEFGFDPTNPIPVRGLAANHIYLESLRTNDGRKVENKRNGSLTVANISGNIDEYEITQSGNFLCNLYISPYNQKISSLPPKNFILVRSDN